MSNAYAEKLKDPRWQKRRLEIFERDLWTCTRCGANLTDGKPFHVHHKRYRPLTEPWEYPDEDLRTLCEDCHGVVHNVTRNVTRKDYRPGFIEPTAAEWAAHRVRMAELKRILGS